MEGMINLLQETLEALEKAGKAETDVAWVRFGSSTAFHCSWSDFAAAANFDYDNGYGGAEIDLSLKIVGDNWWLERGEYDGSEWWEFKTLPTKPELPRVPVSEDLKDK
jgi:hypothetical protein